MSPTRGLRRLGKVTPGRAVDRRAARAGGYVQVPVYVAGLLEGNCAGHALPTWVELSAHLWRHRKEQRNEGGLRPCDVLTRIRPDRSRSTKYRHMALFRSLGLLDRAAVDGRPQRGPGTRIKFFLAHALWQPDREAEPSSPPPDASPPAPDDAPAEPIRGPPEPADVDAGEAAGAWEWSQAARTTLQDLKSRTE